MNPDEIPLWFAIPASVVLCILWRLWVVADRRSHPTIVRVRVDSSEWEQWSPPNHTNEQEQPNG